MTSTPGLRERLAALFGRRRRSPERWVVVDTETSGLDPARDALLAIGAVAVDDEGIRLADSFEVVLRHDGPVDAGSVLVHGLGHAAQRGGAPVAAALADFADFVAGAPCVGFHVAFDRAVLSRAFAAAGASGAPAEWLDVADLAATLDPDAHKRGARSLDDCLARYGIETLSRHTAAGDALATAELLLRLRARAAADGHRGFSALAGVSRQHRWL
ncbi:MAG: 3'-5' exonuclease [Burkholderiales bacterium]